MLDADQWMKDMQERMDEAARKAEAMTEELKQANVTLSSSDGSVTVTVAPNGGVQNIQLGHRACDLGHTKLTALIMETLQKAQKEMSRKFISTFQEAFPNATQSLEVMLDASPYDLEDFEDEDATPAAGGKWAVAEPEPEPEPVRRPQRPAPAAPPVRRPRPADDEDTFTDRPW